MAEGWDYGLTRREKLIKSELEKRENVMNSAFVVGCFHFQWKSQSTEMKTKHKRERKIKEQKS